MEVDDGALQKLVAEVEREKIYKDRAKVLFKLAATEGAHKLQTAWEASTAAMARIEQAKNHILVADVLNESEARIKTAQEVMTKSEIVLNALFGMVFLWRSLKTGESRASLVLACHNKLTGKPMPNCLTELMVAASEGRTTFHR